MVQVQPGKMRAHFQDHERRREGGANPEPALHKHELGVCAGLFDGTFRLERHPANGTISRHGLPDLRVHRAGVDDPRRGLVRCRRRLRFEVCQRVGRKFCTASLAAKAIGDPVMKLAVAGGPGIDAHAAHGIARKGIEVLVISADGHGRSRAWTGPPPAAPRGSSRAHLLAWPRHHACDGRRPECFA